MNKNKLTIYQKPTCSTCRNVMMMLKDAGVEFDAINYILEPPDRNKLGELVAKMGATVRDIVRKTEPEYRELGLDDPTVSDDRLLDAMVEHPSLIQRPILEYGNLAVLARPADRAADFISAMTSDSKGSPSTTG